MMTFNTFEVKTRNISIKYCVSPPGTDRSRGFLVVVHGRNRAMNVAEALAERAQAAGFIVLAPVFDAETYYDFQILHGLNRPGAAADALYAVCEDAAQRLGIMPAPFALMGFSAGAQFAHRYAMRFPGQVTSLVSVSAGWYTLPYTNLAYPFGCAPSVDLPEGIQDIDKFLRIPTRVMVGENDIKRNMWLRTSPALDESQGSHRLGRAQSWVEAVSRTATARNITASISLEILPNCGHSSITAIRRGHLVQRSISFLTSNPAAE